MALGFLTPLFSFAQTKEIDSLRIVLHNYARTKNYEKDTAYINKLNNFAFRLSYLNTDSSVLCSLQSITLSKNISYYYGMAEAYKNAGLSLNFKGNYDSALVMLAEALKISDAHQINAMSGRVYHNIAIVYTNLGNYLKASENYFRALKIREQIGEKLGISSSNNGIGTIYFLQGRYKDAEEYYKKALQIAKEINYRNGIETGYANIGEVYFRLGDYKQARSYLTQALKVTEETRDRDTKTFIKTLLGSMFSKEGKYTEAMQEWREANALATAVNSSEYKSRSLTGIGQVFYKQKNYDSALYYINKGLAIATAINYKELQSEGHELLSLLFEAKGNGMQALFHAKQFKLYADSINNLEAQQMSTNLAADYEYSKKELLLKTDFEKKNTRQNWIIFSAFAALLTAMIIAFVVYRSRQKEKKINHILTLQRDEIHAQRNHLEKALTDLTITQKQLIQSEKMASLGEMTAGIAHEIQNPLNFVNNFSEVSKELLAEMNEALEKGNTTEAKEISQSVIQNLEKINHHGKRADAIVKGMLMHSRNSNLVKELTNINALCDEYLRLAYQGLRAKDKTFNAKFNSTFDESIGAINIQPQEIGRVILNLINNAFYSVNERKKISPDSYEPTVILKTKKTDNKIEIRIADNGKGIPQNLVDKIFQPFFTTKPTGQGTGLGLSLSYDIITKGHNGELKVNSKEGEGAEFVIILPV